MAKAKKRQREKTADIAQRWEHALAPLLPLLLQEATAKIESFLTGTQDQTDYLNDLRALLTPTQFWAGWETEQQAIKENDTNAAKIASISFPSNLWTLKVSEGMQAEVEQSQEAIAIGHRDHASEVIRLSRLRADLMVGFIPAYLHAIQKFGEGKDEKACQFLVAYNGFPDEVAKQLKYALRREASTTFEHIPQEYVRDQVFSELAPSIAILRNDGNAPLSPQNLFAMRGKAVEEVRSTFDPTRPEEGFTEITDDLLADPSTNPKVLERQQAANEAYNARLAVFQSKLSPAQEQITRIVEAAAAEGVTLTDQQIATQMLVATPDVANQRRRMLKKWDPELYEKTQRKKVG